MTPQTFNVPLTQEEISVVINLMRMGARAAPENAFDAASESYAILRGKFVASVQSGAQAVAEKPKEGAANG